MPAPLAPDETSKPLSLRVKHTTDNDLRECAEASKMKIGEISRLLLDGSLEMLRQAYDSEGDRLPEVELPEPLEKIAKALHKPTCFYTRSHARSVRDMAEDNSKMIKALKQEVETLKKVINL